MERYEVIIAGTVYATYTTKEEAENSLAEIRQSIIGRIHPYDCLYIRIKS